MKRKYRLLLLSSLLLLAVVLLSSCGGIKTDPATGEQVYTPGIFEFIAYPLRQAMIFFYDRLAPYTLYAWGWSIILVAALVRLLLLPLGLRQMKSMRSAQVKMKALQPDLDALKKKYGKDKKKFQEEQMKLYQQHGITQAQMAGCLPTLLQMPILFAFYYALLGLIASGSFNNAPFYFIPNLAYPSYSSGMKWLTAGISPQKLISPEVWPYLVLPIVLAVTQFIMTKMSQASQPTMGDPQDSSQRMMGQMTILMTGMFVLFSLQVPAGMSLYWVVGNLLAMAQQYYVNRQKDHWDAATVTSMPARSTAVATDVSGEVAAISANGSFSADSSSTAMSDPASSVRRKRRKRR